MSLAIPTQVLGPRTPRIPVSHQPLCPSYSSFQSAPDVTKYINIHCPNHCMGCHLHTHNPQSLCNSPTFLPQHPQDLTILTPTSCSLCHPPDMPGS